MAEIHVLKRIFYLNAHIYHIFQCESPMTRKCVQARPETSALVQVNFQMQLQSIIQKLTALQASKERLFSHILCSRKHTYNI